MPLETVIESPTGPWHLWIVEPTSPSTQNPPKRGAAPSLSAQAQLFSSEVKENHKELN